MVTHLILKMGYVLYMRPMLVKVPPVLYEKPLFSHPSMITIESKPWDLNLIPLFHKSPFRFILIFCPSWLVGSTNLSVDTKSSSISSGLDISILPKTTHFHFMLFSTASYFFCCLCTSVGVCFLTTVGASDAKRDASYPKDVILVEKGYELCCNFCFELTFTTSQLPSLILKNLRIS